jgi:hypothetical protein
MVASSKSLRKLGICKAAQNQEDFTFNSGGFFISQRNPHFFCFVLGTERTILKSLQLPQVEFSQNLTFYMALLKDCIARADSSFKVGLFGQMSNHIEDHFYYNWSTLNLYAKRWDLC